MSAEAHAHQSPDAAIVALPRPIRRPTNAELRVLLLVALGLPSREIAARLWVSRQAITYHIGNLFMKLRAESRAGLVARAYAVGILGPGVWPPTIDPSYIQATNTFSMARVHTRGRQLSDRPSMGIAAPVDEQASRSSMEAG
ncbi:MAG: helix-turn-helix transcriptional regulator [Actinomycetota bacterium]